MIINSITARNVLKYASLNLQQVPEQGLIAITGLNESGKSSIGEIVCFALFGRSFSLDFDDLTKIIRWNETHCSVELEFTPTDGIRYRIERFLDDAGNHSARLALADSDRSGEPLALGIDQVADKVYELIGYEYEEFIESFYLAQREITTPHPHSYALKTMAGLVTLEFCAEACRTDYAETLSEVASKQEDLPKLQADIEALEIDPLHLAELQTERDDMEQRAAGSGGLIEMLDTASVAYLDTLPKRELALGKRGWVGIWSLLWLLLVLFTGACWYLLTQMPSQGLAMELTDLNSRLAFWQPGMAAWLPYPLVIFGFLFLAFMFHRHLLANRIMGMERVADGLSAMLDDLPEVDTGEAFSEELVSDAPDPSAEESNRAAAEPPSADPESIDWTARSRLSQRICDWQAGAQDIRDGIGVEQNLLRRDLEEAERRKRELEQTIAEEKARLQQAEQLREMLHQLRVKIAEREQYSESCTLAEQLIQGATRDISHRFNRKLRNQVGKILPLFTENRYQHLQIEDDLSVRAFSDEKRDFMELDEISSGTQRQIMLAVRLALSQELVDRTVHGNQFLFLDEPFAFFDEKRTRSALTPLPTLSQELSQIWIIGQAFADDLQFALHIQCERDADSISLPAA